MRTTKMAEGLGRVAHDKSIGRACALDKDLLEMFRGREIGQRGNEAMMKAWYKGWDEARREMMLRDLNLINLNK
jgi:hypothetical protein